MKAPITITISPLEVYMLAEFSVPPPKPEPFTWPSDVETDAEKELRLVEWERVSR